MWSLVAAVAMADDVPQYRQIITADGRRIVGEVLATDPDGLRMRTPQGTLLVGFESLLDMTPASAADYGAQGPWRVWLVAPDALRANLAASIRSIPKVKLLAASDLRPDVAAKVAPCADSACLSEALKDAPFTYVLVAEGARVVVRTNRSDEPLLRLRVEDATGPALLQVDPAPPSAPVASIAPDSGAPHRLFVRASVVSGYPELAGVSGLWIPYAPLAAEVSIAATGVAANPLTFSASAGAVAPVVDGPDRRGGVDVVVGGLGGFRWFVTPDRGIVFAPEVKASGDLTLRLGRGPALDVNVAAGAYFAGRIYPDLRLSVGVAL